MSIGALFESKQPSMVVEKKLQPHYSYVTSIHGALDELSANCSTSSFETLQQKKSSRPTQKKSKKDGALSEVLQRNEQHCSAIPTTIPKISRFDKKNDWKLCTNL